MKRLPKAIAIESSYSTQAAVPCRSKATIAFTVPGGLINRGIALVIQGDRVVCRGSRLDAVRWLVDARAQCAESSMRYEYAEVMDC